jgi:hypothetical protein
LRIWPRSSIHQAAQTVSKILLAAVVRTPAVQNKSFMAIGTPSINPSRAAVLVVGLADRRLRHRQVRGCGDIGVQVAFVRHCRHMRLHHNLQAR